MLKFLAKAVFDLIPPNLSMLQKASQRYIDRANGDNNSDSVTNGEWWLLKSILPRLRGGVVFDVGANVGEWTRHCLGVTPDLNVHMFEPSAFTFKKLRESEWPLTVSLNNYGLGERDEQLLLHIAGDGSGLNSIHQRNGVKYAETNASEAINIRTIDGYCKDNNINQIDFLKIDVEGHELAVLKGAGNLLKGGKIGLIQFEYGGCNLDSRVFLLDIWRLLESHGYIVGKLYPKGIFMFDKYEQQLETFKYANYVAMVKG
jgi:FkbM family methyltransferase